MRAKWILTACLTWILAACVGAPTARNGEDLFREVISSMPDYADFLTVDELHGALRGLEAAHPELVTLSVIGETDSGNPIYEFQIGRGSRHALLYAFPHPNEPIGSVMLHHLTRQLAENRSFLEYFDYTWHIVICADPDRARLNEGWFKGDLSITKYARNFYRPPAHQQVEWAFPVSYKDYRFDAPTAEARALMRIIDAYPIDFLFSLHNSGFGGAYYYWTRDVPELYPPLYAFIAQQEIPLHLGEPEGPFLEKLDDGVMFRSPSFSEIYDYLEAYSPMPPRELLNSGTSGEDYARRRREALGVTCELPYFYDRRINDTSPSGMSRRRANLGGIQYQSEILRFIADNYEEAKPLLTTRPPFLDVIEELVRTGEAAIVTMESAVRTDPEYERQATIAEMWDALYVWKFYALLNLGQFLRLLEHERAEVGDAFPQRMRRMLDASLAMFEKSAAEVEGDLDYSVVPIKKLASVQLLTALHAMDYVQHHPEFGARP
jgi:hypothetical protein